MSNYNWETSDFTFSKKDYRTLKAEFLATMVERLKLEIEKINLWADGIKAKHGNLNATTLEECWGTYPFRNVSMFDQYLLDEIFNRGSKKATKIPQAYIARYVKNFKEKGTIHRNYHEAYVAFREDSSSVRVHVHENNHAVEDSRKNFEIAWIMNTVTVESKWGRGYGGTQVYGSEYCEDKVPSTHYYGNLRRF